jgi:hypothetical protein
MKITDRLSGMGRVLTAVAILGTLGLTAASQPAQARVSTGAAVGIGVGAFALGSAIGAAPYYNSYYAPYGYAGYGYPPPAYYYPPAPAYYPPQPRSCWDPYYGRYYAC